MESMATLFISFVAHMTIKSIMYQSECSQARYEMKWLCSFPQSRWSLNFDGYQILSMQSVDLISKHMSLGAWYSWSHTQSSKPFATQF
jgi:hypothetical protein